MSKRQGRHGESLFEALCQAPEARINAVLNKAGNDEHGWDHVIDLTPPSESDLPVDLRDHHFLCFAQIKTTRTKVPRTRVKLSNAIKSAKSPNPSFIFLFHYTSEGSKPTLYGKHIWRDEIENYLKRAREISVNQSARNLFDVELSISFNEQHRISDHPSDWMLAQISKYGGGNYAANKLNIVKSVGYGEFTHEGKFFIPDSASPNDIVLHELGLSKHLPVVNFELFDTRFGIRAPVVRKNMHQGQISITPNGRPVTVKLLKESGETFEIPALLFAPRLISPDHKDYKLRVDAGCFDILVSPGQSIQRIKLTQTTDEPAAFLQKGGFMCLRAWSSSSSLDYEVFGDQGNIFQGKVSPVLNTQKWIDRHAIVACHLRDLLGSEKCNSITISYNEFHRNVKDMHLAASFASAGSVRFEGTSDKKCDDFSHLLGYASTQIGEWSVGALYQLEHKAREENEGKEVFYFSYPRIAKRFAFKNPHDKFREFIREEFDKFRQSFETPTAIAMDGDLSAWSDILGKNEVLMLDIS